MFKKLSILFVLLLALNTFFSSFVFAENKDKKTIVALGDSITYGWNLQDPSQAFPYLIGNGEYTVSKNISYPGWKTTDLLEALKKPENIEAIKKANLITLDIGNNDLLQVDAVQQILKQLQANPPVPPTQVQITAATKALQEATPTLSQNLGTIIGTVKTLNPNAPIILYNLYNPFAIGPLHDLGESVIPLVNGNVINPLTAKFSAHVADAYSAFNRNQIELILPGDIHPNAAGHRVLASLANDIIKNLAPQDFDISLTPSNTKPSKKIIITVSTTANEVAVMKWLPGEKTAVDFKGAGTEIKNNQFEITENGKYTVYVMDRNEREKVKVIGISNITPPPAADFTIDLTASLTEETKGPVTVKVSTTAEEILKMKWLAGEKTVDDFAHGGKDITDNQFDVTKNGKYTVYIMDAKEVQKIKVIEIKNIKTNTDDPGKGNPGDGSSDNPGDGGNDNPSDHPGNGGSDKPSDNLGDKGSDKPASDSGEKGSKNPSSGTDHSLPETSTSMYNYGGMGLALVVAGLVSMKVQQFRRKRENM
ncbi:SGNH/GDSL hydrolase family protein [Bacillus xiapuensis]|uniref:GDSL-type esterase/lipase family protein n=1 Tax=Bacillus xiapuensis TaxID=2014075 RepID=A0ABU6N944_9BACI|nr:GDSL-type esterase/lipase family protein [Bacillus xiapuensis]